MARITLTDRHLAAFLTAEAATVVRDTESRLEVRVRPRQGRQARVEFIIRYRAEGQQKTHLLGTYPDELSLARARDLALELAPKLRAGADLNFERALASRSAAAAARKAAESTFEAAAQRFFRHATAKRRRERTIEEYKGVYARHLAEPLGQRPLEELRRSHFEALADALAAAGKGPATVAAAMRVARAIMRTAQRAELINQAPSFSELVIDAPKRSRRWRDDEIALIWRAAETLPPPRSQFIRASILLATRRGELSRLRWENVLPDRVIFPEADTKKGREHVLPLSALALGVIEELRPYTGRGEFVFSFDHGQKPMNSFSKTMADLMAALERPIPKTTYHDVRRTFAHWAIEEGGFAELDVAAILSHVGTKTVTAGYIGGALGAKRRTLAAWHEYIQFVLGRSPAAQNVVPFPASASA